MRSEFALHHREALMSAKDRLIGDGQMGLLFKVMGWRRSTGPTRWGFRSIYSSRHCEARSAEAIRASRDTLWIASLRSQ